MSLSVGTVQNNSAYEQALEGQGVWAGIAASCACGYIGRLPSKAILKDMYTMNDKLSTTQISDVRNAIQSGLKESKLVQKGVKFLECPVMKPEGFWQKLFSGSPVLSTFFGKNACFLGQIKKNKEPYWIENGVKTIVEGNTILTAKGKMVYSWFHEMGHALNFNNGGIAKILQKMRGPATVASIIIPTFALLSKSKKENGEKPVSKQEKTTNFIRNNAGKLTLLCFLPALIEEGLATAKGQKWAEKLLSQDVAKKALKHNKLAFLTYVIGALATSYAAYAGVKAKDMYIENIKKQQQNKIAV